MRTETISMECDLCGLGTGPIELDVEDGEDVIEHVVDAPLGWVSISVTRAMPNPARAVYDAEQAPPVPPQPTNEAEGALFMEAMARYSDLKNVFDSRDIPTAHIVQAETFYLAAEYAWVLERAIPGCWEDSGQFPDLVARVAQEKAKAEAEAATPASEEAA